MRLALLGTLILAACQMAGARDDKEAERVKALRKDVLQNLFVDEDKSESVATAYKKLFTHVGLGEIPKLREDEDLSIALQAAWESHRKVVKRNPLIRNRTEWVFDKKPIEEFLKVATKRLKSEPPGWWKAALLKGEVFPGQHHAFIDIDGPPPTTTVKVEKEVVVISTGKQSVRMTKADFERDADEFEVGTEPVALCEADLSFIARPVFRSYPFKVVGVDSKTGKRLWAATVWAARRGFSSGSGVSPIEIRRAGDTVIVYGGESHGLYAEGFDVKTGKCRFRFCTCYWFNFSEAWGLK
jgi:hypothetical protein